VTNTTWSKGWTAISFAAAAVLAYSYGARPTDVGSQEQDGDAGPSRSLASLFELPVVHAAAPGGPDSDGDGLADTFEEVYGTATMRADTDGDGYWDAEELARQSDPLDKLDIPAATPASCGMGIYEKKTQLRPVVALYVADGDVRSADLGMGARVGNVIRTLPLSFFSKNSSIVKTPTQGAQAVVYVFDGTLDPQHVHRFGDLSVYSTVDYRSSIVSADAVNLGVVGGVIVEHSIIAFNTTNTPNPSLVFGQGTTTVYQPLGGSTGTPPPQSWTSSKICAQQMVVSGVNGPVVEQEVSSAECTDGWSSYCGSDCAASAGSTVKMLDPLALIGG
jgi:hypothetical protein